MLSFITAYSPKQKVLMMVMACVLCASQPMSATDPTFTSGPFVVQQGGPTGAHIPFFSNGVQPTNVDTKPLVNSMCVLTRITGDFQGLGESVTLLPNNLPNGGVQWWFALSSQQQGVAGSAYCFNRAAFLAKGDTRWTGGFSGSLPHVDNCRSRDFGTWWGDAATMINGVAGKFSGGGESVTINQSSSGFTPSVLVPHSCQTEMTAWASSFFAGTPHTGQVARFWGPQGQGPANVAGEWQVTTKYGKNSIQMAPTGEAMCYFTYVSGKFRGGAEAVEISPTINSAGVEVWTLSVSSHQDGMTARSLCYKRDQR